jgi:hypothetical protein
MHNAPVGAPAGLSQSMQTLGILPVPRANPGNSMDFQAPAAPPKRAAPGASSSARAGRRR